MCHPRQYVKATCWLKGNGYRRCIMCSGLGSVRAEWFCDRGKSAARGTPQPLIRNGRNRHYAAVEGGSFPCRWPLLEGRVGSEPTTPGLKVRDPSAELAAQPDQGPRAGMRNGLALDRASLMTCLKSRRPPLGGPRYACVVTLDEGWSGRRESNQYYLLGRNKLTTQGRANC